MTMKFMLTQPINTNYSNAELQFKQNCLSVDTKKILAKQFTDLSQTFVSVIFSKLVGYLEMEPSELNNFSFYKTVFDTDNKKCRFYYCTFAH